MADGPDSRPPSEATRLLALLDDLRQAERRAVSSRVASVIGHLIGTPLHVIGGRASLIRANPHAENTDENARRIEEQVERLAQRIRALIEYLTAPEPDAAARSARAVAEDAWKLYEPIAAERGVGIERSAEPAPEVNVDGRAALIVVTSLLSLGSCVAPRGSLVGFFVSQTPDRHVVFEVRIPKLRASGGRIDKLEPPENWDRDEAQQLQVLSVCYAIARRNGGRVEVAALDSAEPVVRFHTPVL